jgi:hypothetical protein
MHTRTRAQGRGGYQKEKKGKLSHVGEQPDSLVRLREARKVYRTTIETRLIVGWQVHYFCTLKTDFEYTLRVTIMNRKASVWAEAHTYPACFPLE